MSFRGKQVVIANSSVQLYILYESKHTITACFQVAVPTTGRKLYKSHLPSVYSLFRFQFRKKRHLKSFQTTLLMDPFFNEK